MSDPTLPFRIGFGYDIHRFAENRPLVLGGVTIRHERGLEGHSDADCLAHAIADAIFGAAGLPDIGHYFPPGDPACKDIDSLKIIRRAVAEVRREGYALGNIDAMVLAEEPKLKPHIEGMKTALSQASQISASRIGIKATTNEGLGAIGRGEGIAAQAVCLLLAVPEDDC